MLNSEYDLQNNHYEIYDCEYFSSIGEDLTEKLLRSKVIRNFRKGDVISLCDKPSNHILLIHKGLVKILTYLLDGREFVVDTPMPGSVFGEIDVLRRTKPQFEVRALTACEVWLLDAKIIRDAIAADTELSTNLLNYVIRRVTELEERLICLAKLSISSRLANTLLRLSSIDSQYRGGRVLKTINISQHELASMLPASREKVNRCLREWERSRIVNLAPGIITITNPRALHAYATC